MPRVAKPKRSRTKHFLREWRDFRGLSLAEAAEPLQTSDSNLARIEKGHVPYNQDLLELAAQAYRCSLCDLLSHDPTKAQQLVDALDLMREAGPEDLRRLIPMIDSYLKSSR